MPTSRYWLHAGLQLRQVIADKTVHLCADRGSCVQIATCAFLDHPLDHRQHERNACRLDRLKIDRCQQPWLATVALLHRGIFQHIVKVPDVLAFRRL